MQNLLDILACPACRSKLEPESHFLICAACGLTYPLPDAPPVDMRLRARKSVCATVEVGGTLPPSAAQGPLPSNPEPEIDWMGFRPPRHLSESLLSYFPRARSSNSRMLDLGCGAALHRSVGLRAGFEYVGMDYRNVSADVLGDAHALPFAD